MIDSQRPSGLTLYDKIWRDHVVRAYQNEEALIYIDRHLVQEVSSPQAFATLTERGLAVRQPNANLAVADHAVPTHNRVQLLSGLAAKQVQRLEENVAAFGLPYIQMDHDHHGIVHIIGPELGFTLPGSTVVCGDSHTSTHGAFGALAFGIGASECATVLATQTLRQSKAKNMRVTLTGALPYGVTSKDIILALISEIGTAGGQGYAIEFAGSTVRGLSMEARMTLCNMAIEAGARIGLVAPDETTFSYLKNRPLAPKGAEWDQAVEYWSDLASDEDATFDAEISFDVEQLEPYVTWGTTPAEALPVSGTVPCLNGESSAERQDRLKRMLGYMALEEGQPINGLRVDRAFIGSCTNARIEDLRESAAVVRGRQIAEGVEAIVVPGSAAVKRVAEAEGLDAVFRNAGFEWRDAGCSMCVAMNTDRLRPGERCASTSNRNFEGRQGEGGRTHLMSPAMVAAAAITGAITDVRAMMRASK